MDESYIRIGCTAHTFEVRIKSVTEERAAVMFACLMRTVIAQGLLTQEQIVRMAKVIHSAPPPAPVVFDDN